MHVEYWISQFLKADDRITMYRRLPYAQHSLTGTVPAKERQDVCALAHAPSYYANNYLHRRHGIATAFEYVIRTLRRVAILILENSEQ